MRLARSSIDNLAMPRRSMAPHVSQLLSRILQSAQPHQGAALCSLKRTWRQMQMMHPPQAAQYGNAFGGIQ